MKLKAQAELGLHPHRQWRAVQRVWQGDDRLGTITKVGPWRDGKLGHAAALEEADAWNNADKEMIE